MRRRLVGGCVYCSLAAAIIPLVWRLETDYGLLLVSSSADPEVRALVLDSLRSRRIQITTVALIDGLTQTRHPHLAQKLAFYSDLPLVGRSILGRLFVPLYEYRCEECATRFEQRLSMADADNVAVCPVCASLLTTRVISAAVWIGNGRTDKPDGPITSGKTHRAGCGCCVPVRKR